MVVSEGERYFDAMKSRAFSKWWLTKAASIDCASIVRAQYSRKVRFSMED